MAHTNRPLVWLSRVFLTLVILAVVALGVTRLVLGHRLSAGIADLKAKGEPVTAEEMVLPQVPDSQNAAVIYEQIFVEIEGPEIRPDIQWLSRYAFDRNPGAEQREEARRAIKRTEYILPLVEQAVARPKCRFDVDEGWPYSHYAPLSHLAEYLAACALVRARDGRMSHALRLIGLAVEVSGAIEDEADLLGALTRPHCVGLALNRLRRVTESSHVTADDAESLYKLLSEVHVKDQVVQAVRSERVAFIQGSAGELTFIADMPLWVRMQPTKLVYGAVFLPGDKAAYVRTTNHLIAGIEMPCQRALSEGLVSEKPDTPWYAVVARRWAETDARTAREVCETDAQIAGSRIFLALLAYHDRYGSYPVTLQELNRKLGWEIPRDPLTGKEFAYKRQDKGFTLESPGAHLLDKYAAASVKWTMDGGK